MYNPFGYAGEYRDAESGLMYLRARYYDPATQQLLTRDPMEGASGQPYAYAASSPLNYVDPSGMWFESAVDVVSLLAGLKDIGENGLNWGNGIGLGADVVSLALPIMGGLGFAVRGARGVSHADDAVTLYRIEALGNERFLIDNMGNVTIQGDRMLFVSFDAKHAAYFLQKRLDQGYPSVIKAFDIDSSFLQTLRADRVPQRGARRFPGRPQWVDRKLCTECYGIPSNYFEQLRRSVIQGTGRIYGP